MAEGNVLSGRPKTANELCELLATTCIECGAADYFPASRSKATKKSVCRRHVKTTVSALIKRASTLGRFKDDSSLAQARNSRVRYNGGYSMAIQRYVVETLIATTELPNATAEKSHSLKTRWSELAGKAM
jgi:hypothetical protein